MNIENIIGNFEKNNMSACYVEKKEDVLPKLCELLSPGDTVALGGSVTLNECGVPEFLKDGPYNYLDRYEQGLSRTEIEEIFRDAFSADAYLCSSNAITENGMLYNVDGNANRVAAICFGPKSVIIVAGINKIVPDIAAAHKRVKEIAAPLNCKRLACRTYCAERGVCVTGDMFDGCTSPGRICCNYVISGYQRTKNRIKIIIVGERLGY